MSTLIKKINFSDLKIMRPVEYYKHHSPTDTYFIDVNIISVNGSRSFKMVFSGKLRDLIRLENPATGIQAALPIKRSAQGTILRSQNFIHEAQQYPDKKIMCRLAISFEKVDQGTNFYPLVTYIKLSTEVEADEHPYGSTSDAGTIGPHNSANQTSAMNQSMTALKYHSCEWIDPGFGSCLWCKQDGCQKTKARARVEWLAQ